MATTLREQQIIDFAILEASEAAAQAKQATKFSRANIARLLGVGVSTLTRWEENDLFIDTMVEFSGSFSEIRIVFELQAIAAAQGSKICIDLPLDIWKKRLSRWKAAKNFQTRCEFYQNLSQQEQASKQEFWRDRFQKDSDEDEIAGVTEKLRTEVKKIQTKYAWDHIIHSVLQTPGKMDAFFVALENRNIPNVTAAKETLISASSRVQLRAVELISALEDSSPHVETS